MFGQELEKPTKQQLNEIETAGINPTNIKSYGEAEQLINKIHERSSRNLSTPKQIRQLNYISYQM